MERQKIPTVVAGAFAVFLAGCSSTDVARHFDGYEGAFVIHRLDDPREPDFRYNASRCAVRFTPCSTFKVANAIIGLETGVLRDENTLFEWDGTKQSRRVLEQDHTLASAVKVSCVWYFARVARAVGPHRMKEYLETFEYGNQDISAGLQAFWLGPMSLSPDRQTSDRGSLKISADEQVEFLTKLYRDELPVAPRVAETVKRLLVFKTQDTAVLSGKTGTGIYEDGTRIGWFVGHLRTLQGAEYVFATNIHGEQENLWGGKARTITEAVLQDLGLWDTRQL